MLLKIAVWIWCILAIPTAFSRFGGTAWYVFMGFAGLALVLLTSQTALKAVIGGQKRKASGDQKEEDQLDGSP